MKKIQNYKTLYINHNNNINTMQAIAQCQGWDLSSPIKLVSHHACWVCGFDEFLCFHMRSSPLVIAPSINLLHWSRELQSN